MKKIADINKISTLMASHYINVAGRWMDDDGYDYWEDVRDKYNIQAWAASGVNETFGLCPALVQVIDKEGNGTFFEFDPIGGRDFEDFPELSHVQLGPQWEIKENGEEYFTIDLIDFMH